MRLLLSAFTKFILGFVLLGVMLFVPAGTLRYFGAWLFLGVLLVPMLLLGIVLFCKAPELRVGTWKRRDHEAGF